MKKIGMSHKMKNKNENESGVNEMRETARCLGKIGKGAIRYDVMIVI